MSKCIWFENGTEQLRREIQDAEKSVSRIQRPLAFHLAKSLAKQLSAADGSRINTELICCVKYILRLIYYCGSEHGTVLFDFKCDKQLCNIWSFDKSSNNMNCK